MGTPNSVKNLYASMLGQNIGVAYESNQVKSNLYAVASSVECGNAQAPDGDIMLPHQFLRYLLDLAHSIRFVLPRALHIRRERRGVYLSSDGATSEPPERSHAGTKQRWHWNNY